MSQLQAGQMLGAYRIISQIGQGGMATVYKAYQASMDRNVAIKVLPSQLAESKEFTKRFQQEAHIIAKLEHAHILPVFDYGESDGIAYFVMRYLDAGTLKEKMESGPLLLKETDRLFTQLADALGYAHSHGVVHRDLKPSNAMVDAQGNLFLTDFGIAKILESASPRLTQTDAIMGTPAYISPEQAQAVKVDQRSDIYSLGIILYEMVTGRVPYVADTPLAVILKHVSDPLPLPSTLKPDIPEAIENVILKALAKNPNDRYATTSEFIDAWKRALDVKDSSSKRLDLSPAISSPPSTPVQTYVQPAPTTITSSKPDNRTRWIVGCLVGACLLLTVAGVVFIGYRNLVSSNQDSAATELPAGAQDVPLPEPGEITEGFFKVEIGDEIMNGEPEAGAGLIEAPGSKDVYTFAAEAGDVVYIQIVEVPETSDLIDFYMTDDLGSDVFYRCLQCGDPGVVELTRGGIYTLTVGNDDPNGAGYGAYHLKVLEVAPADEFTIELDDEISRDQPDTGAGYIENPGSTDAYTFTAESGQLVYFQVVEPPQTSELINWAAFDEIGNALFDTCLQCGDPGLFTLERGGLYRIYVGNQTGAGTGTYSIKIWSVLPPGEFEIAIGDTVSNGSPSDGAGYITTPGDQDYYRFTASAGATVQFSVIEYSNSNDLIYWRLTDDQGNELFNTCLQCGNPEPITFDRDGTYTIIVGNDTNPGTGSYSFEIKYP